MPENEEGIDTAALAALRTGAALLAPLGKDAIVARGADRVRFLHGVVTGNVAGTPVGGGTHALLLTAKAHILAELRIFVRQDELYLFVPAGQAAAAAAELSRYAVMDDFVAEPAPGLSAFAVLGPDAAARLGALGLPAPALATQPAWSHVQAGALWLARAAQLGTAGFWVAGGADDAQRVAEGLVRAGTPRLSPVTAEAARIAAGEPRWGHEITDEFFPMEIGLGGAIDYTKGCFLGQEPIVRIRDRGHTNWRLAGLSPVHGPASFAVGDRLETEEKPKGGRLTSVARGVADGIAALGVVHVSIPDGTRVRVVGADGFTEASVVDLKGP